MFHKLRISTLREWKCALSQQNDKKLNFYLLEETFSHYFYKFLRPQAKKKRFFSKTLSREQESHKFFCKNQGGKGRRYQVASAKPKIRHVFGDTFSCRAAPPGNNIAQWLYTTHDNTPLYESGVLHHCLSDADKGSDNLFSLS